MESQNLHEIKSAPDIRLATTNQHHHTSNESLSSTYAKRTSLSNDSARFDFECCDDCECKPISTFVKETKNIHLFKHDKHAEHAYQVLNELRNTKALCDLVITSNNTKINCHKVVLVASSPYFRAMFTNNFEEAKQNGNSVSQIEIKQVDSDAFCRLIDYMYTGYVVINIENVQSVLDTADILQLSEVKQSCCDFLLSHLDVSNCIGIRHLADTRLCTHLLKKVESFIEEYFCEVTKHDEFLHVSCQELCKLLSNDHLVVPSETFIYEAAIKWISHDSSQRIKYMDSVMANIRFPLIDSAYLQDIAQNEIIKQSAVCSNLIIEALLYLLAIQQGRKVDNLPLFKLKPRVPFGLPKLLLIIGGQSPKAISNVDLYDFRSKTWKKLNDIPNKRCRAGVVYHNGLVYVIGGFNGSCRVRSVDIYNPMTDEWSQGVDMLFRRSTLGVSLIENKIYAIGGFDGTVGISSAECFDINTRTWSMIASMSVKRSSVGVTAMECDGKMCVFAVGGYCGDSKQCLDTVEKYNPETNTWTVIEKMHNRRSGAAVCVHDGKLYVFGGHDGPVVHKSAEYYDPKSDTWHLIADMNVNKRNSGAVSVNNQIYSVGGDDGQNNLSIAEVYDPKENTWEMITSFLPISRSYSGVIVIEKSMSDQVERL